MRMILQKRIAITKKPLSVRVDMVGFQEKVGPVAFNRTVVFCDTLAQLRGELKKENGVHADCTDNCIDFGFDIGVTY